MSPPRIYVLIWLLGDRLILLVYMHHSNSFAQHILGVSFCNTDRRNSALLRHYSMASYQPRAASLCWGQNIDDRGNKISWSWYVSPSTPVNSGKSVTEVLFLPKLVFHTFPPKMSSQDSIKKDTVRPTSAEYGNREFYPNITHETITNGNPNGQPYPFFVPSTVKSTLGSPVSY